MFALQKCCSPLLAQLVVYVTLCDIAVGSIVFGYHGSTTATLQSLGLKRGFYYTDMASFHLVCKINFRSIRRLLNSQKLCLSLKTGYNVSSFPSSRSSSFDKV